MGSRKEKGEPCEMGKSDHVLCLDRVVVTNFCSGSHMGTAKNGRSRSIVGLAGSGRPQNWIRGQGLMMLLIPAFFLFLRFSEIFSCDFLFANSTRFFCKLIFGSVRSHSRASKD